MNIGVLNYVIILLLSLKVMLNIKLVVSDFVFVSGDYVDVSFEVLKVKVGESIIFIVIIKVCDGEFVINVLFVICCEDVINCQGVVNNVNLVCVGNIELMIV